MCQISAVERAKLTLRASALCQSELISYHNVIDGNMPVYENS